MLTKLKTYFSKLVFDRPYPSFYLVNALGWITLIIFDTFLVYVWMRFEFTFWGFLSNSLQWSTGFFITSLTRIFYKKSYVKNYNIWKMLIVILAGSFFSAVLLYMVANIVYAVTVYPEVPDALKKAAELNRFVFRMTQLFPMMTAWSMLYFGIKFWFDISAQKEKAEKADLLAQSAQLQMLRYQVNPHFLFNSFSSLRALIRKSPNVAADMVGKLSEFYRYSLITKSNSEVPLKNEIEAIEYYAEIEKIRFDEKIEFLFNIESSAEEFLVPSFIIHPLFENAIKYGMLTSELPLIITVNAEVENDRLKVRINNTGKWLEQQNANSKHGTGTGLSNIRNRLDLLCPGKYKLNVFEEDNSVKAILEITRGDYEEV